MLHLQQYYVNMLVLKNQAGEKRLKKAISTILLASLININVAPSFAIQTTESHNESSGLMPQSNIATNQYKYNYINLTWWKAFDDAYLTAYVKQAIDNNHSLKASSLATQEYYQAMKAQFAAELPQITTGFLPGYSKLPTSNDSNWAFSLPIFATYELDLFAKNRNKTQSSRKSYEVSLQNERSAHISVASAVGTTYFNLIKLDKTIELQENIVKLREDIFNLEKLRYDEGIASAVELVNSEKAFISAQNNLIELKKYQYTMLNQFAVLIGESPENAEQIQRNSLENINYSKTIPTEISTEIIVNRPDYQKAELSVAKAGLDVKIAKKEMLPSIKLGGLAFFNSDKFSSLLTTNTMLAGLGGGILWPIFTGGQRIANLKIKKAQYERILENYYQTNLTAIQEVNDSLYILKSDDKRYNQIVKQYELEKKNFTLNQEKFAQGIISKYDLLRFEENLLSLEIQLHSYKTEKIIGFIGLYKATGSNL